MQIISIVQGRIPMQESKNFESEYSKMKDEHKYPEGLINSYLLKSDSDQGLYRIQAIWKDIESLEKMRGAGTPRAVALFEKFGVKPIVSVYRVVDSI